MHSGNTLKKRPGCGATAAEGNLVSGNTRGMSLEGDTTGVTAQNNAIGLDINQAVNLADSGSGIQVFSNRNTIGAPGAGNVITGMTNNGIQLINGASGNTTRGNWIGTNQSLDPGLGNAQAGIFTARAYDNAIGGLANGEGNVIANNSFMGVQITRGDNNEISGNSIFGNELLGIDVGKLYVFPNDPADPDITANRAQNYPLLSSVTDTGTAIEFLGMLQNEPDTQYRVAIFSGPTCDETGFGEGWSFLGSVTTTTDPGGIAYLDDSIAVVLEDDFVSATATDPLGNTSEFSPCAEVGGSNPGQIQFFRDVTLAQESDANGEVIITAATVWRTLSASTSRSAMTRHSPGPTTLTRTRQSPSLTERW